MAKTMCFILGLALLAVGILGFTEMVPMLTRDPDYINIGEIVLGSVAILFGIYSSQGRKYVQPSKDLSRQVKDNSDRQRQENEQLKRENEQGRREIIDRQEQENERLRKQLDQQQKENENLR
jgi:membrane protein involved in colicin uptake